MYPKTPMKTLCFMVTLGAILVVGTTVSTLSPNRASAQEIDCNGIVITFGHPPNEVKQCIPMYVVIEQFPGKPEPPCLCPIKIVINPRILEKLGLTNEPLINIDHGKMFDNVTLRIPAFQPQIQSEGSIVNSSEAVQGLN